MFMSLYLNKKPCWHYKSQALLGKHKTFIMHNLKRPQHFAKMHI